MNEPVIAKIVVLREGIQRALTLINSARVHDDKRVIMSRRVDEAVVVLESMLEITKADEKVESLR